MSKIKILNAKSCVAVFTAVLMMILSLSYTSNNQTDAANTNREYYVYNAKTGSYKTKYTLNAFYSESSTRAVIGNDERVIDWTKSGIVKIMNSTNYIGTGFVIGDHTIATAAHCAYNNKISEILLFDNNGNITLHATPVEYHIPYEYTKYSPTADGREEKYDYALITVKEDLSNYACFNLGVPLDSFANKKSVITVTGFPVDQSNSHTKHTMYSSNGIVTKMYDDLMYYNADTYKGNSGGPVYITESLHGNTYYTVVAINAYSPHDYDIDHSYGNHGAYITTDMIHFYNKNSNINW